MYEYKTRGTCSSRIQFDIKDGRVYSVSFEDGCEGNLQAISKLVEGMKADELVEKLKGINCGRRGTSCAAELAQAVESAARKGAR